MKVVGFSGFSGSGKTTLIEQLVARLRAPGLRVSVIKHAHHAFDVDREGKDSWRHRKAGAYEVLVASDIRFAKMREFESPGAMSVHALIAELDDCDWVIVEGFKRAELPKIEVWRQSAGHPVQYPDDGHIVAVATDDPASLPTATLLPVLDLNDADAVVGFLMSDPARYEYRTAQASPADTR
jgi:molybdopterin-guanine dinucleotide biosynthesis protein B